MPSPWHPDFGPPPGELLASIGKQWVLTHRQPFPSGWARVRRQAVMLADVLSRFSVTEGDRPVGTFEIRRGQLVRVEREESIPGHVWVLIGPVRVSFPVDELEPAEPPPTRLERLVGRFEL